MICHGANVGTAARGTRWLIRGPNRGSPSDAATIALGPWADKPDDLEPDMRALVLWRAPDSAAMTATPSAPAKATR